ncbi:MAG: PspC domain-containing protein [Defluviitaleaceae bacterium]|nr:PspC domain-containing protein [Defluviitaleaceae bacterium]
MPKKLYKSRSNVKIDGICAGIAEYTDCDPTLVRLIMVIATLVTSIWPGVFFYLVAAMIIPRNPA